MRGKPPEFNTSPGGSWMVSGPEVSRGGRVPASISVTVCGAAPQTGQTEERPAGPGLTGSQRCPRGQVRSFSTGVSLGGGEKRGLLSAKAKTIELILTAP